MNILSLKMMKLRFLNLLKMQKTIFKGGENMDENVIREIDAIEKLLKSYEIVNSSLENRVRILEFNVKKMKEDIESLKANKVKGAELKND